jgi:putative DNA methylase
MRKKLIEVSLPLEAINVEAAREKSIRHGHPSTLHLWWARRPLAACRAVLFTSLIDDPDEPEAPEEYLRALDDLPGEGDRREKLFRFIGELVKWENINDETIMGTARKLIRLCTDDNPPPVIDPFCGGGSIPLEAQRLGLEAYASDLNPVAVLITKALIEIPPKFADMPPVNPASQPKRHVSTWQGAQGLAEDVRYYGQWMRDEAEKRIGHLYPKGPNGETVIAWLWARTVKCPNPACGAQMPLVRSFDLSKKKGREVHLEPEVDGSDVRFRVRKGGSGQDRGTVERRGATCLVCGSEAPLSELREWVSANARERLGVTPLAVVVEGARGRDYLEPFSELPEVERPDHIDDVPLPEKLTGGAVMAWGLRTFGDLFTDRQLVALTTFSDLVGEAREQVLADALTAGMPDDGAGIENGGTGARAYADAVSTYLAFAVSRTANRSSSVCIWNTIGQKIEQTFGRQAIPMTWDYAEANVFSDSTGSWSGSLEWVPRVLERVPASGGAAVEQLDAATALPSSRQSAVATDPPYYDNIGYADLSDFFYVWLRRGLGKTYPTLLSTLLTPKAQELVATSYRFGGDTEAANEFFESGLRQAFLNARDCQSSEIPMTVYYAFKQEETRDETGSVPVATGWETMLAALTGSGFLVTGTWPMRTERDQGLKSGTNVLASSVLLVCRPRHEDAPLATRRELEAALRQELPEALGQLTHGGIAPVDLAQASIGPGMAIFSRYSKVLEADGNLVTVRTALQIINQELDRYLAEQESEFDRDTRFCIDWFTQFGQNEGAFGEADVLARAKNTSVDGLVSAGVLEARRGKVRVLGKAELKEDWKPSEDSRVTVWECAHHLIRKLDSGGEAAAAALAAELGGGISESARALAYRLYSICDRKGWADLARDYNNLVVSWPVIRDRAAAGAPPETGRLL